MAAISEELAELKTRSERAIERGRRAVERALLAQRQLEGALRAADQRRQHLRKVAL